MTKLLEDAIRIMRELTEDDQDEATEMLLYIAVRTGAPVRLDDQPGQRSVQDANRRGGANS